MVQITNPEYSGNTYSVVIEASACAVDAQTITTACGSSSTTVTAS
jgi:hypothetical protein